jgi:hypothetical protein
MTASKQQWLKCVAYALLLTTTVLVPKPSYARGGLFHGAFKMAGWLAGSAVKAVPSAVKLSVATAKAAAHDASAANSVADNFANYSAGRIGGTDAHKAMSFATGITRADFATAETTLSDAGSVLSGKVQPTNIVRGPVEASIKDVVHQRGFMR